MMRLQQLISKWASVFFLCLSFVPILAIGWFAINFDRAKIVIDTQEEIDAVAYLSMLSAFAMIGFVLFLLCLFLSVVWFVVEHEHRIRKLEKKVNN